MMKPNMLDGRIPGNQLILGGILIPTDYLMDQISKIVADKQNIVGIQIRCGDYFISNNIGHQMFAQQYHNSEKYRTNIPELL